MKKQQKIKDGNGGQVDYTRQGKIHRHEMSSGRIDGWTEIILSDGKTVVYCKAGKDPVQVRSFWENRLKYVR